jgi:Flp pilus assembly protein TadG
MIRRRKERGQALVEFALVAPILFLLLFSVIQLGLLFGAQNGLVNGVRETARRAATYRVAATTFVDGALTASICQAVRDELETQLSRAMPGFSWANISGGQVTYRYDQNPDNATWFLAADVDVTYSHPLYVPLVSFFFDATDGTVDNSLALSAREQMRIENPPQTLTDTDEACPAWN